MKESREYRVWDTVSYGYGEPLMPSTQVAVFNTLQEVQRYVNKNNSDQFFVLDESMVMLFKVDNGLVDSQIYSRNGIFLDEKQICKN